ncbi:hypothetical protein COOONC_06269 [Cooperia oncophora]
MEIGVTTLIKVRMCPSREGKIHLKKRLDDRGMTNPNEQDLVDNGMRVEMEETVMETESDAVLSIEASEEGVDGTIEEAVAVDEIVEKDIEAIERIEIATVDLEIVTEAGAEAGAEKGTGKETEIGIGTETETGIEIETVETGTEIETATVTEEGIEIAGQTEVTAVDAIEKIGQTDIEQGRESLLVMMTNLHLHKLKHHRIALVREASRVVFLMRSVVLFAAWRRLAQGPSSNGSEEAMVTSTTDVDLSMIERPPNPPETFDAPEPAEPERNSEPVEEPIQLNAMDEPVVEELLFKKPLPRATPLLGGLYQDISPPDKSPDRTVTPPPAPEPTEAAETTET